MSCSKTVLIGRRVRAIKGLFGSDSSKSTKFGPEVDNATGFTLLPGAKIILNNVDHKKT